MSSALQMYKTIVSEVYALTLSVTQGKYDDAKQQFNGFLDSLQIALESKDEFVDAAKTSIHIPPHLEILHDSKLEPNSNVVVFKDDMTKNVVLRNYPVVSSSQDNIKEDEELSDEMPDVGEEQEAEEQENLIEEEVEDQDQEEEVAEEEEEAEEEEAEEEEDVEEFEINGKKYYLAPESKRVFAYIDDETPGDQIGKLMNGNVIPL